VFPGWEPLTAYKLPGLGNPVQDSREADQKRWDAAQMKIDVMGNGGDLSGWPGIIRSLFHKNDWLSIIRASDRTLYAWEASDDKTLSVLESQLFDTTKYQGVSEFMTVYTYGSGYYGTISLFSITLEPKKNMAQQVQPRATMTNVPKALLRSMRKDVNRIEMVQKGSTIRFLDNGSQFSPSPVKVSTRKANKKRVERLNGWQNVGDGWRSALGVLHEDEADGLVATIPQMLALLHLKGYGLHNLKSSPPFRFANPLTSVRAERDEDGRGLVHDWKIERGVKILEGPERNGHQGSRAKVVVLFPSDGKWPTENIFWA
jgi:hypothetical protein